MSGYQDHPLSLPKHLLERLTPVKPKSPRPAPERRKPASPKKRTLSASEVLDKVSRFRKDHQEVTTRRKLEIAKELENAGRKRKARLKQVSERARRFNENDKIWSRFKVKADVPEDDGLKSPEPESEPESEPEPQKQTKDYPAIEEHITGKAPCTTSRESSTVIGRQTTRFLRKRRVLSIPLFNKSIEECLYGLGYDRVFEETTSPLFGIKVRSALLLLRAPGNYKSVEYPVENIIKSAYLYLSSATNHKGNEQLNSANLGKDAVKQFGGYGLPQFTEYHYDDDSFYNYLSARFLRQCFKLLKHFQHVVNNGFRLYDADHLRFLKHWRRSNDLLNLFNVYHSHRLLLIGLAAIDDCESHMALNSTAGINNDSHVISNLEELQDQVERIRKSSIFYRSRYKDKRNHWFTSSESLRKKVEALYSEFLQYEKSAPEDYGEILVPPGFTLLAWRRFRLYDLLDKFNEKHVLRAGLKRPLKDDYSLEENMARAGVKTFKEHIEDYKGHRSLKDMNNMLISIGCFNLSESEKDIINNKNCHDADYVEKSLLILRNFTKVNVRITNDLQSYFNTWRRLMNLYTNYWVKRCSENIKDLTEFEMKVFYCNLYKTYQSPEDVIAENDLKLYIPQRRVDIRLSVVEYVLRRLRMGQGFLSLQTFEIVRDELERTFNELRDCENSLITLWCLSDDEEYKKSLMFGYKIANSPELINSLDHFKLLIDINFQCYRDFYQLLKYKN